MLQNVDQDGLRDVLLRLSRKTAEKEEKNSAVEMFFLIRRTLVRQLENTRKTIGEYLENEHYLDIFGTLRKAFLDVLNQCFLIVPKMFS